MRRKLLLTSLVLFALSGCKTDKTETSFHKTITIETVNQPFNELINGSVIVRDFYSTIKVVETDKDTGIGRDITNEIILESSQPDLIRYRGQGVIVGLNSGVTYLSAHTKSGHKSNTIKMNILDTWPAIPPTSPADSPLVIMPDSHGVTLPGLTNQHHAVIHFENGLAQDVTSYVDWNSSQMDVADFSSKIQGQLKGNSEGQTFVTASINDIYSTVNNEEYVLSKATLATSKLLVKPKKNTLLAGTSTQINVELCVNETNNEFEGWNGCTDVTPQINWKYDDAFFEVNTAQDVRISGTNVTHRPQNIVATLQVDDFSIKSSTTLQVIQPQIDHIEIEDSASQDILAQARLAKGLEQQFSAIAYYKTEDNIELQTSDITKDVAWSYTDTNTNQTTTLTNGLFLAKEEGRGVITITPENNKLKPLTPTTSTQIIISPAELIEIIAPDMEIRYLHKQPLKVEGLFTDGEIYPIPSYKIDWTIPDTDLAQLNLETNEITASREQGQFDLGLQMIGYEGEVKEKTITISILEGIPVCGIGINDNNLYNWFEECIKVVEVSEEQTNDVLPTNTRFTSTPSKAALKLLGYRLSATGSYRRYGGLIKEDSTLIVLPSMATPTVPAFKLNNNQAYKLCEDYNTIHFGERTNWRLPNILELKKLRKLGTNVSQGDRGVSMNTAFGWPTKVYYWSTSKSWLMGNNKAESLGSTLKISIPGVPIGIGVPGIDTIKKHRSIPSYVSCISPE